MPRARVLVACVVSAALGLGVASLSQSWSAGAAPSERKSDRRAAVFGVRTSQRLVALTFDDGPDPRWTPRVLALLHDQRVERAPTISAA